MLFTVKLIPLIIGTVFNMALGALWYSPVLFANPWMKEAGITAENIEGSQDKMGKVYALTGMSALLTSYVIGVIMINLSASFGTAVAAAILLWLGMDLPMIVKNWGFEDRSIKLGLINHGYQLVVYLVVGVVYTFF